MRVDVVIVGAAPTGSGAAGANRARLTEQGLTVRESLASHAERSLAGADVAVDAVFGTGFHGEPQDVWLEAIDALNAARVPVVAVDIPSGVDGRTGAVQGSAVWADLTVAFGAIVRLDTGSRHFPPKAVDAALAAAA